jgi:hypothetical protein
MKNKIINQIIIITILSLLLSSCGSSIPRNELQNLPSLIEIMAINMDSGELRVRVSHRNNLTKKNNQISCQLALKDLSPIKFNEISLPDLTNYATETVSIMLPQSDLPTVTTRNKEMPYVLDCYLFSENFREEHLIKKSTLFKVPGTNAEYR